ncbi:hypothetical protein [Paracoccus sp. SSK6]|uniref:hypothetical protein n=1 Tax=Paracoccus sp. SSK6 TaxID=3143131 RepID=UPI00321B2C15
MKGLVVLLIILSQPAYAAWDIRQCTATVRDRHGIRIEEAMKICAGSQAKRGERRRCVIDKVKNQRMTAESALNSCLNGPRRSDQSLRDPGRTPA